MATIYYSKTLTLQSVANYFIQFTDDMDQTSGSQGIAKADLMSQAYWDATISPLYYTPITGTSAPTISATDTGTNVSLTISGTWDTSAASHPVMLFIQGGTQGVAYYTAVCDYSGVNQLIDCDSCRDHIATACADELWLDLNLSPSIPYVVHLADRWSRAYTQSVTADADGGITIDATSPEWPVGFFAPENGIITVTVYDETDTTVQSFTISGVTYGCMHLSFEYKVTTTSSIDITEVYIITDESEWIVTDSDERFIE